MSPTADEPRACVEGFFNCSADFSGTHSHKQCGSIMPDMLRWLPRDHPRKDDPKDASNRSPLVPTDTTKAAAAAPAPKP
jgi:hypothetical protein